MRKTGGEREGQEKREEDWKRGKDGGREERREEQGSGEETVRGAKVHILIFSLKILNNYIFT